MIKIDIYIGGNIYGAGNIGDDAVLEGIIKIINQLEYNFCYTIGTYNGVNLKIPEKNIKYINCYDNIKVIDSIINSNFIVCGGGTLIGDELSLGFPLLFNAELIATTKFLNKKVFIFSIGANKMKTKIAENIVRKVYSLADIVVLRDKESYKVCEKIFRKSNFLFESADPAFVLSPEKSKRTEEVKRKLVSKNKYFGVNVINEVWAKNKEYKKSIGKACELINSKYNFIPVFFCNEIRSGNYFDYEANKETTSYLNCKYILLEPIYYSPSEMIEIITNFQFVFAMRMHAMIFASIAKVPFVSISRVDKVDNFMNLFNLKVSCSIINTNSRLLFKDIEYIIKNREQIKKNISNSLNCLKDKAMSSASIFDKFIKNRFKKKNKFTLYSLKYIKYKSLIKYLLLKKAK